MQIMGSSVEDKLSEKKDAPIMNSIPKDGRDPDKKLPVEEKQPATAVKTNMFKSTK